MTVLLDTLSYHMSFGWIHVAYGSILGGILYKVHNSLQFGKTLLGDY